MLFQTGDRVYHRKLKRYGIFVQYAWESDEECDVEFETEDGFADYRHVSVCFLECADNVSALCDLHSTGSGGCDGGR